MWRYYPGAGALDPSNLLLQDRKERKGSWFLTPSQPWRLYIKERKTHRVLQQVLFILVLRHGLQQQGKGDNTVRVMRMRNTGPLVQRVGQSASAHHPGSARNLQRYKCNIGGGGGGRGEGGGGGTRIIGARGNGSQCQWKGGSIQKWRHLLPKRVLTPELYDWPQTANKPPPTPPN